MKIGLFIPCYIDQFYPQVGVATLRLLESLGVEVGFPLNQTCCGQPMANSGFEKMAQPCNENFVDNFREFEYIVGPTGSCVLHVKDHLHSEEREKDATYIRQHVYELCEFLTDVLKVDQLPKAYFPHKVGLHTGCHGQRGLGLSSASEIVGKSFSKPETLLGMVRGLELVPLTQRDECCGFGGTFCVFEAAVSAKMGKDRVDDHVQHGAEYITGGDVSCLMHLEGIARRQHQPVGVRHIAEILASGLENVIPFEGLYLGDKVQVVSNEGANSIKEGIIEKMFFHHKQGKLVYHLRDSTGKELKKRYFKEDLKKI